MIPNSSRVSLVSIVAFASFAFAPLAFSDSSIPTNDTLAQCQKNSGDRSSCVRNTLSGFINHTLRTVSYGAAKSIIFHELDVYTDENGRRAIDSVYSPHVFFLDDSSPRYEERMPRNGRASFNIEHTWPQSHLKKYARFESTKADMFHLFPVESHINSERGNIPFVDCHDNSQDNPERESAMCDGGFQPPAQHRGKVARAMFYMAVTYNMSIDPAQEAVLRSWNKEFPVSQDEIARDAGISKVQHAHNPFILHPEWVELIKDF